MTPFTSNIITTEDKKSVSTFDDTKSTNSVKVIEVKEQKDSHVETEKNIGGTGISGAVKDAIDQKEEEEERKDNGQNIIETGDILSLEEILYKELEKFSTAGGVCWHLSKDKKRTLCMFFVRYQSSYLPRVKQSPL